MNDAAHDYVKSQFFGPKAFVLYTAPPTGYLKCSVCGTQTKFRDDVSYEDQACCIHDDCIGQMFCIKWPNWASNSK